MLPLGLIALIGFWAAAIRLWMLDGPKIPLIFIALWVLAFFGFPMLHWYWSGVVFVAVESILAVILLLIGKYKAML